MLECVVNISEGRDRALVGRIAGAAGDALLDVHSDPHHHRSVLTMVTEEAARAVADVAVGALDLRDHVGVHPRLGVIDVVPFVALAGSRPSDARAARDSFAAWLSETYAVPCFLYGPERSLPDVRRTAFRSLMPDLGPATPHPTAGATAVGCREVLVAYNVWVADADFATTKQIAATVRGPALRALGLDVGGRMQVSMNLTEPLVVGPAEAHDLVEATAHAAGATTTGAELVGLVPRDVLDRVPPARWGELDLSAAQTIEARLEARGLR
ncbi:MAG: hypothetical protein ACT4OV_04880 [Microthrixaceae bacterium]